MEITNIKTVKTDGRFVFRVELRDGDERREVEVDAETIVSRRATKTAILESTGRLPSLPLASAWTIYIRRWLGGSSDGAWETKGERHRPRGSVESSV